MIIKPCNKVGCFRLVQITDLNKTAPCYCEEHLSEYYSKNRNRYQRHRYGKNWPKIRSHKLFVSPFCECKDSECGVCFGNHSQIGSVVATEVDHLVRFSRWQMKDSAHKFLQSLCKPCHSSKTNKEARLLR